MGFTFISKLTKAEQHEQFINSCNALHHRYRKASNARCKNKRLICHRNTWIKCLQPKFCNLFWIICLLTWIGILTSKLVVPCREFSDIINLLKLGNPLILPFLPSYRTTIGMTNNGLTTQILWDNYLGPITIILLHSSISDIQYHLLFEIISFLKLTFKLSSLQ